MPSTSLPPQFRPVHVFNFSLKTWKNAVKEAQGSGSPIIYANFIVTGSVDEIMHNLLEWLHQIYLGGKKRPEDAFRGCECPGTGFRMTHVHHHMHRVQDKVRLLIQKYAHHPGNMWTKYVKFAFQHPNDRVVLEKKKKKLEGAPQKKDDEPEAETVDSAWYELVKAVLMQRFRLEKKNWQTDIALYYACRQRTMKGSKDCFNERLWHFRADLPAAHDRHLERYWRCSMYGPKVLDLWMGRNVSEKELVRSLNFPPLGSEGQFWDKYQEDRQAAYMRHRLEGVVPKDGLSEANSPEDPISDESSTNTLSRGSSADTLSADSSTATFLKECSAKDSLEEDGPSKKSPGENDFSEESPADGLYEDGPSKESSEETSVSENSLEKIPAESSLYEDGPSKKSSGEDSRSKENPVDDSLYEDGPSKESSGETSFFDGFFEDIPGLPAEDNLLKPFSAENILPEFDESWTY